jgi:hypothetical protein
LQVPRDNSPFIDSGSGSDMRQAPSTTPSLHCFSTHNVSDWYIFPLAEWLAIDYFSFIAAILQMTQQCQECWGPDKPCVRTFQHCATAQFCQETSDWPLVNREDGYSPA